MPIKRITALARETPCPRGGTQLVLPLEDEMQLVREVKTELLDIERTALKAGIIPERYVRNMDSITPSDQLKLLQAKATLIGLGGLGGSLLECLVRLGLGEIRTADGDHFEPSNLNRQVLATATTLGHPKTLAAAERCRMINPATRLHVRNAFLDQSGMRELIQGTDVVLDALGDLASRRELVQACKDTGVPLVAGALAGWSGYVALVRPGEPHPVEFMGGDDSAEKILGCPAPSVALVAALMAGEAVNVLLERPTLGGKMLVVDMRSMSFEKVRL
ncbi:MAG: ThiF family adenylyltransferase [Desulfovibrionaceae bacterium]